MKPNVIFSPHEINMMAQRFMELCPEFSELAAYQAAHTLCDQLEQQPEIAALYRGRAVREAVEHEIADWDHWAAEAARTK